MNTKLKIVVSTPTGVSRSIGNALTGASAGAVVGGLTGVLPGAIVGAAIGAVANVAIGLQTQRSDRAASAQSEASTTVQ